ETADAAPGPTVLHVLIVGYVVNVTPIGNVPPEPAGTVFHLTVNVTPMGAVEIAPELTGGNPPVGGTNLTTDQWWKYVNTNTNVSGAVVCSLDGLSVAIFTAVGIVPDPCVPNILSRFEGTTTLLGPPLRDWVGIGSASAAVPLFENMTWVNLTPDRLTNAGPLNFTPGAYLTGDVYVQGTTDPPPSFSVQACSTDEQEICGPVVGYAGTGDHGSPNGSLAGCDTGPSGFCVPAPPGPVVLSVTGSGTVTGTTNTTWAYVPYRCCVASPHALSLWNSTDPHVRSINLTNGYGRVAGQVASGGGVVAPTLSYVEVEACLVSATSNPPCSTTVTENGSFSLEAAIGWNQVTATASGYMSNSTWIDVTGSNTTGTIVLTPLAVLTGRVVTPNGTGVLGAVLQYCPIAPAIASQPGCTPVGSGATGTGGYYSGPLPGGPFPSSAYQVIATASGYSGNWTWVNVTPGALVVAPRIVLEPIGNASAPSALALGPRPQNGSLSTWVVGRVADARTHLAIPDATLTACSIATSSTCVPFSDSTSTGGEFNATLGLGAYELSVGMDGYVPATLYLNATGLGTVDLGTIGLTPYPWVAGRVAIAPWPSLTIADGLGPDPAGVTVCTSQQAVCGPTGLVNTAGFFNVSAPVGASDDLAVNASGGVTFDGLTGAASQGGGTSGFVPLGIPLDVPSNGTTVGLGGNGVPTLSIFAPVTGTLYDLSTSNSTAHRPGSPARWATLEVSGPQAGAAQTMYISGGGQFTALVPPNETVRLVGSGSAYLRVATGGTAVGAPATAV
ncbi:MAG TPA: hypothetical protein VN842_03920, partial [Thermoplasmata archaeon]|nr:hypothetical protein [Thermoplasmata archaeon]